MPQLGLYHHSSIYNQKAHYHIDWKFAALSDLRSSDRLQICKYCEACPTKSQKRNKQQKPRKLGGNSKEQLISEQDNGP